MLMKEKVAVKAAALKQSVAQNFLETYYLAADQCYTSGCHVRV